MNQLMIKIIAVLLIVVNIPSYGAEPHPPIYVSNMLDAIALSDDIGVDVLVIFTAGWCGACQVMKTDIVNDGSNTLANHIICYVDYDDNTSLVKEYRVKKIPDYFILRKRKEIKRRVGYKNFTDFKKWIENG